MTAEEILAGQILLVDKPLDWTSFQAVNKLKYKIRHQFGLKKFKIGHAGTLDPRAAGLLVICTGKFTKKIPQLQDAPKEYIAKIKIGAQTESYDTEKPEILQQDISGITPRDITETLKTFVGKIEQFPPAFSAVKIDGKRAYDLARAGLEVEVKSRRIEIFYINNISVHLPFIEFTVGCSKGTYIRSLAHDIGQKLEVGAYLSELRRTKIGAYSVEQASANILSEDHLL